MTYMFLKKSFALLGAFFITLTTFSVPLSVFAEDDLEVSGWIPYWSESKGTKDAKKHLDELDMIYPFSYTVKSDGKLNDLANMDASHWKSLIKAAKRKDVLVVPTIMTSDGAMLHKILSDKKKRASHIKAIVSLVKKEKFDGIDIDYEAKQAQTKDYFSLFLKELKDGLNGKLLTCTVEARTPADSLYRNPPAVVQYANDYPSMAKYCDQIEIMAYDQQRADIKLNDASKGAPYMPNSDPRWVRKVVELALRDIPREKLVLGIPTYGTEYEVTVSPNWYQGYTRVRAINPGTAEDIADDEDIEPSRNQAGEISFTYATSKTADLDDYDAPEGTSSGNEVAARALEYANATGNTTVFNVVSWSDAPAIEEKVEIAREFNLKGVSIFKIDGGEDKDLWEIFEN